MDVLSSQANIAGYKAVLLAAAALDRYVPMLMTAAGTIQPSRVLILGAGVAGLQALATARRLGGVVYVSDVRPAAKEQVESLGGRFIDPPELEEAPAESGGYAQRGQRDLPGSPAAPAGGAAGPGRHGDLHRPGARPAGAPPDQRGDARRHATRVRWWSIWPSARGATASAPSPAPRWSATGCC